MHRDELNMIVVNLIRKTEYFINNQKCIISLIMQFICYFDYVCYLIVVIFIFVATFINTFTSIYYIFTVQYVLIIVYLFKF